MNYIILDMEWDNVYLKSKHGFINQILQIGAVKCDDNLNIIDTLKINIKSSVSKKVSSRFTELTKITTEEMLSGIPLKEAVEKYNKWVGSDFITLTWSNSDLYSIAENEKYLTLGSKFKIEKYLDLQKYIQNEIRLSGLELKSQISLQDAAKVYNIGFDDLELHTAKDDSLLCLKLLRKNFNAERFFCQVQDTRDPAFYKKLYFKSYYLKNLSDEKIGEENLNFFCDKCGEMALRKTKWRYHNRWFFANFYCKKCRRKFQGRISVKKTFDSLTVRKRICEIKKEENNNAVQSMPEKVQCAAWER